jgi:hypothetical protein
MRLIKHESIDGWANYSNYFCTHNIKNIFAD